MKFTIRDLFLVTVIVALALGWGLDHLQLTSELASIKKQLDDSPWQAHLWEKMAKDFAKEMRDDGWYVRIDADGSGYSITDRKSLDPETAARLNRENPLP